MLEMGPLNISQEMCLFDVMETLKKLEWILSNRSPSREKSMSIGEQLEQANQNAPGKKQRLMHTPKTPTPSSGMDTMVKKTLSLMNSEDSSQSPICSDGWTDTLSLLKSKGVHAFLKDVESGLHQI